MSSASWILNTRRFNFDITKKINALQNKFNSKITSDSTQDDQQVELSTKTEGAMKQDYFKFCDADLNALGSIVSPIQTSMPSFEPDNQYCKCFVEFDSTGGTIPDYSGFNHPAKVYGIPRISGKGIDYGYGTGMSMENVFDGRSTYGEIIDHADLNFSSVTTGFSLFFRFVPYDLAQSGGFNQVVISKKDATAATDWYSFEIFPDGRAAFNMVKASVIRSIVTPIGTIAATPYASITPATTRYDVCVKWDQVATTLKLFINNVAYTTVNSTLQTGSQTPTYTDNSLNLRIGRYADLVAAPAGQQYPLRNASKLYYGSFQQFKYFREKVVTDLEVGYHYTNKTSITNTGFARVATPGTFVMAT